MSVTYKKGDLVTYRSDVWDSRVKGELGLKSGVVERPLGKVYEGSDKDQEYVEVVWSTKLNIELKTNLIRWDYKHLG